VGWVLALGRDVEALPLALASERSFSGLLGAAETVRRGDCRPGEFSFS